MYPPHLRFQVLDDFWASDCLAASPPSVASMRFVFLGSGPASGFLPTTSSRKQQLPSARSSRHQASRGLSPPSHIPVGFRLPVASFQRDVHYIEHLTFCWAPCPAHERRSEGGVFSRLTSSFSPLLPVSRSDGCDLGGAALHEPEIVVVAVSDRDHVEINVIGVLAHCGS